MNLILQSLTATCPINSTRSNFGPDLKIWRYEVFTRANIPIVAIRMQITGHWMVLVNTVTYLPIP
jgi:hypothetical protein